MDQRAQVQKARVDPGEANPEGTDHLWVASVCRSWGRWEEPGR